MTTFLCFKRYFIIDAALKFLILCQLLCLYVSYFFVCLGGVEGGLGLGFWDHFRLVGHMPAIGDFVQAHHNEDSLRK